MLPVYPTAVLAFFVLDCVPMRVFAPQRPHCLLSKAALLAVESGHHDSHTTCTRHACVDVLYIATRFPCSRTHPVGVTAGAAVVAAPAAAGTGLSAVC